MQLLQVLRGNESGKGRRSANVSASVSVNVNAKGSLLLPLTSTYDQVQNSQAVLAATDMFAPLPLQ